MVVIVVIIVVGLVLNRRETAVQSEGYGASTQSVATEANGVVTVVKPGSTPTVKIDVFEDALCPICAEFERQFGQQINKAVDDGSLAVNFHMLELPESLLVLRRLLDPCRRRAVLRCATERQ